MRPHMIRRIDIDENGQHEAICVRCLDWGEENALAESHCYGSEISRMAHEGS